MTESVVESLILLNKIGNKDLLLQVCDDAYEGRSCDSFSDQVLQRAGHATALENPEKINNFLRCVSSFRVRALKSGWERPEEALKALNCSSLPEVAPMLSQLLPHWRTMAIKHQVAPPKLVAFSTQVGLKPMGGGGGGSQPSCTLNLTLEDGGKQENLSVELPKATMATLLADLGRVRDQLSVIAGQK